MSMLFPEEDDQPIAAINTTPLVDVMLVLLIIFLITIPVALHTVPVTLPKERSQPNLTPPGTVSISIDREGRTYWNEALLPDEASLMERLRQVAAQDPQPTVQLRGDRAGRFGPVGKLVSDCRQAGIQKLGFVTEPQPGGTP